MDQRITQSLVKLVELKDAVTAAHTWRVALYAQAMAERDDASTPDRILRVMNAAVLHDLGKIDIPSEILAKPGRLTDAEYSLIKQHPVHGHERLLRMGERDALVLSLVRWHHERIDGSGYPDGLVGEEIPLAARQFAVIDAFDAMTSLRPYRSTAGGADAARAIDELRDKAGTWYCPQCVQQFADMYSRGVLDWILDHFNDRASLNGLGYGGNAAIIHREGQSAALVDSTLRSLDTPCRVAGTDIRAAG